MTLLIVSCNVNATCSILPSEDPLAITRALKTILDNTTPQCDEEFAHATSMRIMSLEKIRRTIQSRASSKAWRKKLRVNTEGDSTWVYLNKQAAAAGVIALCSDADESPLGPITLNIKSKNIEAVIDWLVPRTDSIAQQN